MTLAALWEVVEDGPMILRGTCCFGTGYFEFLGGPAGPPSVTLAVLSESLTPKARARGGLTVRPDGRVLVGQTLDGLKPMNAVAERFAARLKRCLLG